MIAAAPKSRLPAQVVTDESILGGAPVVRGTRVPAATIVAYLRAGHSAQDIFEDYPSLPLDGIDAVIEIEVPRDDLIARLAGRRVCPVCGAVYHLEADPPRVQGTCDRDGSTLVQRDDDTPDAIRRRLEIYDDQTKPLLSYYEQRGLVTRVDGNQPIEAVTEDIVDAIAAGEAH
jgi:adenylate kinase family enzyme